jgi:hypothetical protein
MKTLGNDHDRGLFRIVQAGGADFLKKPDHSFTVGFRLNATYIM